MDNIRFVLVMALLMISYMLWEQWQIDYGPKPKAIISDKPLVAGDNTPSTTTSQNTTGTAENTATATPVAATPATRKVVTIQTDVYRLEIDTEGGTVQNLDLLQYPHEKVNGYVEKAYALIGMQAPAKDLSPIRLLDGKSESQFVAQTGLVPVGNSAIAPDHHSTFETKQDRYQLAEGSDELTVPLTWTNQQGLTVTKTFTFKRGSYVIDVQQSINNQTAQPWSGRAYQQLLRTAFSDKSGNNFVRTFAGGVVYTEQEKFKKIKYEEMTDSNLNLSANGGWSGFIQHYFASAWIPASEQENHFYSKSLNNERFVMGSYGNDINVAANQQVSVNSRLFVGPKIQPMMEAIAPGLELTVDYSWLTVIGKPIYSLLNFIHSYVGNWGLAIMGVTLFIKLLFFKLSKASFQSMAKMRKVQPKLKELQERYADDRQKFNTEMMALYKREKVNPLGGCLPILVQIPVFISLYWVLIETVELRQADFMLWIQDLSAQDPFYILPIIYGITMKIQQSLNPAPVDPLQAQVMKMFPIVFTVFFLFFPSGLVVYWICNNTLSILQQWYITKHVLEEDPNSYQAHHSS